MWMGMWIGPMHHHSPGLQVLEGYSCTVFAFGQTGSGKTHTITGSTLPIICESLLVITNIQVPTIHRRATRA